MVGTDCWPAGKSEIRATRGSLFKSFSLRLSPNSIPTIFGQMTRARRSLSVRGR